ncbi:MAG: hypothetical protein KAT68_00665 [Bacteroidales bacterium]|nr:hypothetical protein [Bacteroidales bacterium]
MANKKTGFIRKPKELKKTMAGNLTNAVVRNGSALGVAVVNNKFKAKLPEKAQKILGPAQMILGVIGEAYVEQPQARAIAEGIGAAGTIEAAKAFDKNNKLGLSGVGEVDSGSSENETSKKDAGGPDWDEMARQAEEDVRNMGGEDESESESELETEQETEQEQKPQREYYEDEEIRGVGSVDVVDLML